MNKKMHSFFLILGIAYVLIGALGISSLNFFMDHVEYIVCVVLFLNGINHLIYLTSRRKDPYFHWGVILLEGIIELISVGIILLSPFSSPLFFTTYLGGLLCLKGLILTLGRDNKLTAWENTHTKVRVLVVVKGLLHFLFGSLIILLPIIGSNAYYNILGWYILFLGIHFVTYEYTTKEN